MSDETNITINGHGYKLSDFTTEQIAFVQQIKRCATKIRDLELDLGQAKMANDGFIHALEKTLIHTVQGPVVSLQKSA